MLPSTWLKVDPPPLPPLSLPLLDGSPQAAELRGELSRTPLSLAFLFEAPSGSVEAIRDAYPAAIRDGSIVADYQNHGRGPGVAASQDKKFSATDVSLARYNLPACPSL